MKKHKRQSKTGTVAPVPKPARPPWAWFAIILLAAFALRADTVFNGPYGRRVLRGFETQAVADSLVNTGQFANPFRFPTGPTAHLAPLFPMFLSGLMRATGNGKRYEVVKELCSALAASLQYALLPLLAFALRVPKRVGIAAALLSIALFAAAPVSVRAVETQGSFEHTYVASGAVAVTLLAATTFRSHRFSPVWSAVWGFAWGVFLLLVPSMALVYPALLIAGLLCCQPEHRRPFALFAACSTATLLLTLTPWTVRNLKVLGSPIWGRDNLGLELYASNNDCAAATYNEMYRSGCHARTHPNASPAEAALIVQLGEAEYNSRRLKDATGWIVSNPGRFITLTAKRVRLFWFPELGPASASLPLWLITVLGFAGIGLCFVRNRLAAALFAAVLVFYSLGYSVVQHNVRYRYPILWASTFMASYALMVLWQRMMEPRGSPRP